MASVSGMAASPGSHEGDEVSGARGMAADDGTAGTGPAARAAGHRVGVETRAAQQAGHGGAAVTGSAHHVHRRAPVKLRHAAGQLAHRDEHGTGHVAGRVLARLAYVNDRRTAPHGPGELVDVDLGRLYRDHRDPPCCRPGSEIPYGVSVVANYNTSGGIPKTMSCPSPARRYRGSARAPPSCAVCRLP